MSQKDIVRGHEPSAFKRAVTGVFEDGVEKYAVPPRYSMGVVVTKPAVYRDPVASEKTTRRI